MALLEFNDLSFQEENDNLKINFLRIFSTTIPKEELKNIGEFKVNKKSIEFKDTTDAKASRRFNFLLAEAFKNLKNTITGKKTIYIHQNSQIPLIGNSYIGLIDRNTSIIEVRVITGCNIDCIYCSVDQNQRPIDFVVEKDYLVQEFKELVKHKGINGIEAHIGTQGEPLLYEPLPELIKDLAAIPEVETIALDTNGTLLTKNKIDELVDAGLTRFCFSINALDAQIAEKIANVPYKIEHIRDMAEYIATKDCQLILTPVWMPKINDDEIPKIIEFAQKLNADLGIQNFLNYQFGKNPTKQMSWEVFKEKLENLEKKYNAHLLLDFKEDFKIQETKPLQKPFKKGDVVKATIVAPGRLKDEMLAMCLDRTISVPKCDLPVNTRVKLKITREKHNIFYGVIN